jgi:hypothetical protein
MAHLSSTGFRYHEVLSIIEKVAHEMHLGSLAAQHAGMK